MSQLSPGTMIVSVFAVLFGLVGAYSVKKYLEPAAEVKKEEAAAARERVLSIPLAGRDLQKGRKLVLGDISILQITRKELAKRKDVPTEFMSNPRQLIGRFVQADIKKGSFFELPSLYPEGTGPSISEKLKKGLRAVTINCEAAGLVNGFVSAGNNVDVIFRTDADARSDETEKPEIPEATLTLLENVEVLAIGSDSQKGSTTAVELKSVTLAVSPKQAAALKVVEGRGTFSLLLRGADDAVASTKSDPLTLEKLLNLPPKPQKPEVKKDPEPKPFTTEIYRGNTRSQKVYSRDQVLKETVAPTPKKVTIKNYRRNRIDNPAPVTNRKAS